MTDTQIAWATKSINPLRWQRKGTGAHGFHCEKIAPECANCYAEEMNTNRRWIELGVGNGLPFVPASAAQQEIYLDSERLMEPRKWRKPQLVFPCSMTDWLGAFVPRHYSQTILATAIGTPRHRWLFLTKRFDLAGEWLTNLDELTIRNRVAGLVDMLAASDTSWPPRNVWIGFSAGTQRTLDSTVVPLRRLSAAGWRTWLSIEPLLEPINLAAVAPLIQWAVVGGEAGPKARPCDLDAIRGVVDQCDAADVPVFVKQVGAKPFGPLGDAPIRVGSAAKRWFLTDKKGENPAEWPSELRRRAYPAAMMFETV